MRRSRLRYFVPDIRVPPTTATRSSDSGLIGHLFGGGGTMSTTKPAPRERLGGVPWGLGQGQWPICKDCGKSQSLLAQFGHDPDRLDLGREGRVLFVFQCAHEPGMCATWEAFSGANACFVVEPEQLGLHATETPSDGPPVDPEVIIADWISRDNDLPANVADAFLTEPTFRGLPDEVVRRVTWSTRLGGAPRWIQSADEAPKPGWRFVGQLDGIYSFLSPPGPCSPWVMPDRERFEGRTHIATGPNFGGGLAYLFLKEGEHRPDGCMFWQR
jgi:hypothetical protein